MLDRVGCIPAGSVIEASFASGTPKFIKPAKQTGSRRAGLLYEEKTQRYLLRELEKMAPKLTRLQVSPWLKFRSEGDAENHVRYCQPDCLIFDDWQRRLTIVEIKLQHCVEAYNQVRKLYEPVLKFMFPTHGIAALEIVSWFDPHLSFPELYQSEPKIFEAEINRFSVHIWNPRYDPLPAPPTRRVPPPQPS